MKLFYVFFVFATVLVFSAAAFAQAFQFDVTSEITEHHRKSMEDNAAVDTETTKTSSRVIIEKDRFSVRTDTKEAIYDLKDEKIISIDHDEKTYLSTSLYAVVAFNIYEKKNREMMGKIMEKALELPGAHAFYIESMFGDKADTEAAQNVSISELDGARMFTLAGEDVASYTSADAAIPAEFKNSYKKYLIYLHPLHPLIVEDMARRDTVFKNLTYKNKGDIASLKEGQIQTSAFHVWDDNKIVMPEEYAQDYASDERLNGIIRESQGYKAQTVGDYSDEMQALLDKEEYMDASLVFHEYVIQTGGEDIERFQQTIQRIFSEAPPNTGTQALTAAIRHQPKSKEELQKVISTLESARQLNNEHNYVLNVFLGNYYDMAGQSAEAKSLIMDALEHNPHLTGAYKDLGDKYFKGYEMPDAWASWNNMQKLNPDHQLAQHIRDVETKIKADHPYYFQ